MDQHLQGSFSFPQTPQTTLSLNTEDGVPSYRVEPDRSRKVLSVDVFYTQQGKANERPEDRESTMHRFWHYAEANVADNVCVAKLPLSNTKKPLWVYANVTYALDQPISGAGYYYGAYTANTFNVSSLLNIATPEELAAAGTHATRQPSLLIESFEKGWEKEWFTYRPSEWARTTHKIGDETYAAPDKASLALDVFSEQPNKLVVLIDDYAAEVELDGGTSWQTIVLGYNDFRDAGGEALGSWEGARRLKLSPAEHVKPKRGSELKPRLVGKHWVGADPQFRNLRWQVATVDGTVTTKR
jgi:hypothetical protein